MAKHRIARGLVIAGLASVFVYAALALLTDVSAVRAALRSFPLGVLLTMLLLSLVGFGVRALRWQQLMRIAGCRVGLVDATYLQLAGQTMTLTPGRLGEVFKPWLARDIAELPMAPGVALVLAERVADVLALCILSLGGLSFLEAGRAWVVPTALLVGVAGTAVASADWFHETVLRIVARQAWARKHRSSLETVSATMRASLSWRTVPWSAGLSVLAWSFEGVALFLCVRALGFDGLAVQGTISVFAVSTLAGALSLLPGGVGLTEASMAGLLVAAGMDPSGASAATLLLRLCTLWWGIGIGWLVLASRPTVLRTAMASVERE